MEQNNSTFLPRYIHIQSYLSRKKENKNSQVWKKEKKREKECGGEKKTFFFAILISKNIYGVKLKWEQEILRGSMKKAIILTFIKELMRLPFL